MQLLKQFGLGHGLGLGQLFLQSKQIVQDQVEGHVEFK
jgi:hypothetical protein